MRVRGAIAIMTLGLALGLACVNLDALQGDGGARDGAAADGGGDADAGDGGVPAADGSPPNQDAPEEDGGAASPPCPLAKPGAGSSCTVDGRECEYPESDTGVQFDLACSTVMICQAGSWQVDLTLDPGAMCHPDMPNSSQCPPGSIGVLPGASCSDLGVSCVYPLTACTCGHTGGATMADAAGGKWTCVKAPCLPRPRIGSTCTSPGVTCTFSACGYSESCSDAGLWQAQMGACPAARFR